MRLATPGAAAEPSGDRRTVWGFHGPPTVVQLPPLGSHFPCVHRPAKGGGAPAGISWVTARTCPGR